MTCQYLSHWLNTQKKTVRNTVKSLKGYDFTHLAYTGASGSLIAPVVSYLMSKKLIIIRKDEECHSDFKIECNEDKGRYVFIDDVIYSGRTVKRAVSLVESERPEMELLGIFLYTTRTFLKEIPVGYCEFD